MQRDRILALSACLIGAMALSACANRARQDSIAYVERPVEQLYNAAADELDQRDYVEAVQLFNEVERQHPYSEWARRSALMTAFAHYRAREYDEAIAVAQRYISLHPGTDEAAYAYYLVAVSYYEQIADVERDQGMTDLARDAFEEVVRRFPDSEYATDARLKLDMVRDQLAGKEMTVGRWYMRRNQHLAAINRFKTVVEQYDTTNHAAEALHRLVELYITLGLVGEAQAAAAVLGYNYPDSQWYRDSYALIQSRGLLP